MCANSSAGSFVDGCPVEPGGLFGYWGKEGGRGQWQPRVNGSPRWKQEQPLWRADKKRSNHPELPPSWTGAVVWLLEPMEGCVCEGGMWVGQTHLLDKHSSYMVCYQEQPLLALLSKTCPFDKTEFLPRSHTPIMLSATCSYTHGSIQRGSYSMNPARTWQQAEPTTRQQNHTHGNYFMYQSPFIGNGAKLNMKRVTSGTDWQDQTWTAVSES